MPLTAAAGNVTLAWNPSTSPGVTGYCIYSGGVSEVYTNRLFVGNVTTVTVSNLVVGDTYYFAATSYDANGSQSPLSGEASYTVSATISATPLVLGPPSAANGQFSFTVTGVPNQGYAVLASTDMANWFPLVTNLSPFTFVDTNMAQFGKRFYRAVQANMSAAAVIAATPVVLGSPSVAGGQFSFSVTGVTNQNYAVLASSNLVNWIPLVTNQSPFVFVDNNMTQFGKRFYRAALIQ